MDVVSENVVMARSLAYLCLHVADLRDKDLATQARFLECLGLTRKEAAALLDSSEASIGVLLRRRAKKNGRKKKAK